MHFFLEVPRRVAEAPGPSADPLGPSADPLGSSSYPRGWLLVCSVLPRRALYAALYRQEPEMQHESRETSEAGERAGTSEAERREKLSRLVLCRSKLSPEEAALLHEVFPEIVAMHHDQVWKLLRSRGLDSHEAEDLLQEVFLTLHRYLLEKGFVDSLPGMLHSFTKALPALHRPALVALREAEEPGRRRARPAFPAVGAAHLVPALAGASGGDRQGHPEGPPAGRGRRGAGDARGHPEIPAPGGQARAPRGSRAAPAAEPEGSVVNDIDDWICFDGPEPEHLRPLLDALRDLPPSTPEDKQRMARRLFEQLDAELARKEEPPAATAATAATSRLSARPSAGSPISEATPASPPAVRRGQRSSPAASNALKHSPKVSEIFAN